MTEFPSIADMDGGHHIAPSCEQYLDRETLGSDEDRAAFIEVVADVFRYFPGPNHTTTPRTYARRFVGPMDAVTVNILHTLWLRKLITDDDINKLKVKNAAPVNSRNFALLLTGIGDLPKHAGTMRQFVGLHHATKSDDSIRVHTMDISTDDLYQRQLTLFRFSVDVSDRWRNAPIFHTRFEDDMYLDRYLYELIWDHPERAGLLADLLVNRRSFDRDLLREAALGQVPASLSEGML